MRHRSISVTQIERNTGGKRNPFFENEHKPTAVQPEWKRTKSLRDLSRLKRTITKNKKKTIRQTWLRCESKRSSLAANIENENKKKSATGRWENKEAENPCDREASDSADRKNTGKKNEARKGEESTEAVYLASRQVTFLVYFATVIAARNKVLFPFDV